MAKFVSTYEKPLPHISLSDWYTKQWDIRQNADVKRSEACQLRNSGKTTRSEGNITTKWDIYMNDARITDRVLELSRWKDILDDLLQKLLTEIRLLSDEKANTQNELENITHPLRIASECISMRDCRRETELTYDEADIELKKELRLIGNIHEEFTKRAQTAWEKLNCLEALKFRLSLDIEDKNETIRIDKDNLELDHTSANISYKPRTLVDKTCSITYEVWLDRCRCSKLSAEKELCESYNFREATRVMREHALNDIKAQQDATDYTLRKRIYQTQKGRNEMEWQKLKTQKEMEMLRNEITQLETTLMSKIGVVKCVETRLENRIYRPGSELCKDEVELGLKKEALQLKQTEEDLIKMIEHAKTSYNTLEALLIRINNNLEDKQHSLNTDVMCLDMRAPLKTGDRARLPNETDRNIALTHMEKEIPLES
ncbi:Tektin-2 [Trachymyrmex septentrionalis]|uniref:Tektin n=1 Tax=Trachymyrmex septentrionalis TaxID=34720 RepID=A0A195FES6_9HYME|nr:PREDICTED: tektin-2 [Trachymyrmex septentrionalis]KYN38866.1 Tektin-2 [Trachymyrmex septentrionalis]